MGQVSPFLRNSRTGFAHWCPGCEEMHHIAVTEPNHCGARWSFDGNVNAPTFSPSINISSPEHTFADGVKIPAERCHYFLKAGQLQFLGDCTHALAGKTVPLPELPPHTRDG